MKRKEARGRGRRNNEEDDYFGEEGLDIDTYESRYAGGRDVEEDDEEVPLKGGRPPVEEARGRGGNDRRGGRRGDARGGDRRGGNRGGYRGGYEERGARSKSRGAPRQNYRDQEYQNDQTDGVVEDKPQQQQ